MQGNLDQLDQLVHPVLVVQSGLLGLQDIQVEEVVLVPLALQAYLVSQVLSATLGQLVVQVPGVIQVDRVAPVWLVTRDHLAALDRLVNVDSLELQVLLDRMERLVRMVRQVHLG